MNISKVLIIANSTRKNSERVLKEISSYFDMREVSYDIVELNRDLSSIDFSKADIVISLGGDGTVLFVARNMNKDIPLLAVNTGTVGFITEVKSNEWKKAFEDFENSETSTSKRMLVSAKIIRDGKVFEDFLAFNDVVFSAEGISKLIKLEVFIGNNDLGVFRSDGIIVSTPTGSTAYSAAAGGPILDPEMNALSITPICPYTLSNRPIVVQGDRELAVVVSPKQRTNIILTIDGQVVRELHIGDRVVIKRASKNISLVSNKERNFYDVLQAKLNWSGGINA